MPGECVGGRGFVGRSPRNCLLFALPSHCQRHRQRGPWYPAERPPPPRVCGISVLLWAPRRPVSHTRRVSGGVGARVLVDSIPLGPSPQPKGHRKGDPLGVSTLVPGPASWMDLKMWSPALRRGSQGGILGFPRLGSPGRSSRTPVSLRVPGASKGDLG